MSRRTGSAIAALLVASAAFAAEDVQVSSRKISQRFQQIEAAEIEEKPPANVVRLEPDRK